MGTVHHIGEARKRRAEANEVMHLVNGPSERNPACPHCRVCSMCGEECCNSAGVEDRWTSDIETWANHTHPCKMVPIIGGDK